VPGGSLRRAVRPDARPSRRIRYDFRPVRRIRAAPPRNDPMSFTCAIVTPSDAVLDTPASYASFEAWDGQQGVATGASAFLTKLGTGVVTVQSDGGATKVFVLDGGFAQMDGARLTLLTERAMEGSGIDVAAAERELADANAKAVAAGDRPLTLEERAGIERAQRLARAKIAAAQLSRK
jgi:F-type H+-transporting ATPase subunit epsilon